MNNIKTRFLSALLFAVLLMTGGIVYAQSGKKPARRYTQTQTEYPNAAKNKSVRISPELEEELETNTIMVINTDEVRIVKNKKGTYGFQLRNLDVLWTTRAAMSGMIAVFMMLIIAFTKANTKQGITVLLFVAGSALMLSFYPLGISFMIMQWNQTYGLAAMGGGALLTIITLFLANRLRLKTKELEDKERGERPIPNVFPGGEDNQEKNAASVPDVFPGGQNVGENESPATNSFTGEIIIEKNEPHIPNVFPRTINTGETESPATNAFTGGISIERNEPNIPNVFPGVNNTERNETPFPSVFPGGNNDGKGENAAPEIFLGGNNGNDDMPEFFSGEINTGKVEMPTINISNISIGANNQGQKEPPAPNVYFGDNNDEMTDIFPGGNINLPPPSDK